MATRAPELDGLHRYLVAGTRVHDRLAQAGGFVRTPQGEPLDIGVHVVPGYRGPVHVVDWTNPEAVRVMREEYGRLLATGAAVVKADFGAVVLTGPVMQRVGERPTDPLTAAVARFQRAGRTERTVPVDGREVAVRYRARAGRHQVEVDGHHGEVLLDAPPGVELRR